MVKKIDLDTLSLTELKELQRDVGKAITSYEDRRRKTALAALEERAKEFGFSVSELTGKKAAKQRPPTKAKYVNPSNPEETWSGRGRKPRWFAEAMTAGTLPDDLSA